MTTTAIHEYFPLSDETELIISIGIEIHKSIGFGFAEVVYKDAFEYELNEQEIEFEREKEYLVHYKDIVLRHRFYADFVIFDSVILEIKAKEAITNEDYARTINYLKCSKCKVGLILNFGRTKLEIKRMIF